MVVHSYLVLKDKKRRKHFFNLEIEYLALKSLLYNQKFDPLLKYWIVSKFAKLSTFFYFCRIKNFCTISAKSKGVFSRMGGLSRMSLKYFFSCGVFYGWERF